MFEQYTESARRVIFFARYEASVLGSASIGTEHLLLGVLREGRGIAAAILERGGLSHGTVQRQLQEAKGPAEPTSTAVDIPLSPNARTVLRAAAGEADRMHVPYVGPEHLLLGLLTVPDSGAGLIFLASGVELEEVREEVRLRSPVKPSQSDHGNPFQRLADLLRRLEQHRAAYRVSPFSDDAIRVEIALPEEKWVVTFFDDSRITVEVFPRAGVVEDDGALQRLFDKLGTANSG